MMYYTIYALLARFRPRDKFPIEFRAVEPIRVSASSTTGIFRAPFCAAAEYQLAMAPCQPAISLPFKRFYATPFRERARIPLSFPEDPQMGNARREKVDLGRGGRGLLPEWSPPPRRGSICCIRYSSSAAGSGEIAFNETSAYGGGVLPPYVQDANYRPPFLFAIVRGIGRRRSDPCDTSRSPDGR